MGVSRLRRRGVPMLVLSTEVNPVVAARCGKLGLECVQGVDDKLAALRSIAAERGVGLADVVYVGNDINDRSCLEAVGCAVVPHDAHVSAKAVADIVLASGGGRGAVRELCDMVEAHPALRIA